MVQIKVFANEVCFKENRPVYEQIIKDSDSDYGCILDAFRIIYGKGCIVTFNFLPL